MHARNFVNARQDYSTKILPRIDAIPLCRTFLGGIAAAKAFGFTSDGSWVRLLMPILRVHDPHQATGAFAQRPA